MDYTICKEELLSCSNGTATVRAELIAASDEDIPGFDSIEGRLLAAGSVAIVPSERKLCILDTDKLWTDWETGDKLPLPDSSKKKENA